MIPGYMGKMLRVDLTDQSFSDEALTESTLKTWVGGIGLGMRFLFEEVPPAISWDHPENRFILTSGPLGGTKVSGSGTFCVCTKGAMTGGATSSQANGYLGAYLRHCGYDGLIIQGAASEWVYLYIDDEGASLRSADHLLGVDTWALQDKLRKELGSGKVSVFGIGPAGENRVRFSAFAGDYGHVAAHNGIGAVLGSKKIKAIVVARGAKKVQVHDGDLLAGIARKSAEESKKLGTGPGTFSWGTSFGFIPLGKAGGVPVKNLTTNIFPENDYFTGEYIRTHFKVKPTTCFKRRTSIRQFQASMGPAI